MRQNLEIATNALSEVSRSEHHDQRMYKLNESLQKVSKHYRETRDQNAEEIKKTIAQVDQIVALEAQIKKAAKWIKQEKNKFSKSNKSATTPEKKIGKPIKESDLKALKDEIETLTK